MGKYNPDKFPIDRYDEIQKLQGISSCKLQIINRVNSKLGYQTHHQSNIPGHNTLLSFNDSIKTIVYIQTIAKIQIAQVALVRIFVIANEITGINHCQITATPLPNVFLK